MTWGLVTSIMVQKFPVKLFPLKGVLHLVPGGVQVEVRDPDLHLGRADGVLAGLVLQVDELVLAVRPPVAPGQQLLLSDNILLWLA